MIHHRNACQARQTPAKITQRVQRTMHHRDQPASDPQDDNNRFEARHAASYDGNLEHVSGNFAKLRSRWLWQAAPGRAFIPTLAGMTRSGALLVGVIRGNQLMNQSHDIPIGYHAMDDVVGIGHRKSAKPVMGKLLLCLADGVAFFQIDNLGCHDL